MTRTRTYAACLDSAGKFDWDKWSRENAEKMNAFRQAMEHNARIDAAIAQAGQDLVRGIRSDLEGWL